MMEPPANDFQNLSAEEKDNTLYEQQKHTLDLFLERHAITQDQYNTGLNALKKQFKKT